MYVVEPFEGPPYRIQWIMNADSYWETFPTEEARQEALRINSESEYE